jgi:hypothetical protein
MTPKTAPILNRYTSLPVALDILVQRRVTLLSPETWEDRNDAFYLERYREEKSLRTLVAICFSARGETFHHWKVFSSGSSGVCIEFDKNLLLKAFPSSRGFRYGQIEYRFVKTVSNRRPEVETWPFLKRKAFKDEGEFRIIYENQAAHEHTKHVDIDLGTINKVTLSPWLPDAVAESVRALIKTIKGCERLPVNRSSLIDNSGWKKAIE